MSEGYVRSDHVQKRAILVLKPLLFILSWLQSLHACDRELCPRTLQSPGLITWYPWVNLSLEKDSSTSNLVIFLAGELSLASL